MTSVDQSTPHSTTSSLVQENGKVQGVHDDDEHLKLAVYNEHFGNNTSYDLIPIKIVSEI